MAKKKSKKAKRVGTSGGTQIKSTKKKGKRTTMRSSSGKKLYAVRDAEGKFKDIQTYARAHAADIRRKAADEP
jgi:hypothetical protein